MYFFGTYMACIEKKSERLSRYIFIFFFLFSVKRRKHQRQSFFFEVLDDMINMVSKNITEPLLSTREEDSSGTGKGGQNRRE